MPNQWNTAVPGLTIRLAEEKDAGALLGLINGLAVYEKLQNEVVATEAVLAENMFQKRQAEALIGEVDGEAVAMALFFHNFSTFLGRAGLYLEDLYVRETHRGEGIGKEMLLRLAAIARARGCGRFEWSCLDWNTPAIGFYESIGAMPMEGWTTFRLAGKALEEFK